LLIAACVAGAMAVARAGSQSPQRPQRAGSAGSAARTQITIWAAPLPEGDAYGGVAYGGYAPVTGALVTEQREIDVGAGDARDARISGVAATTDPASVQLRDLTDPNRLDVVSEEPLGTSAGVARIRVAPDADLTGERRTMSCSADEQLHTLRETIAIALENHGTKAADVVVRESLWRWPVWHIETKDHKGVRAGRQLQEYRVRVPGGGRQAVTYTAVYAW
jgi:hypothetical protein